MGLLQFPIAIPATNGDIPSLKFMVTTDSLATITTAGYLNQANMNNAAPISTIDTIMCLYNFNQQTNTGTLGIFTVAISGATGSITLTQWVDSANVLLPVTSGDFAVFNGTSGQIKDAGYLPSDNSKTNVVMAAVPSVLNHIATYTDTNGTIGVDPSIAINGGSIQAGLSGTGGGLITFSSTPNSGKFVVQGVANGGNFTTVLANSSMGQTTTVVIPDPGSVSGALLIGSTGTPFTSGNFPVASGNTGLMVDSGVAASTLMQNNITNTFTSSGRLIANKVNGTEAANAVTASGMAGVITTSALTTAAGANYAITWTNTFVSSTSCIFLSVSGGTNTTQNIRFKIAPGSGTATLTIYNTDPAADLNGTILISYLVI